MAVITVKALEALTSEDNGRRFSMGESLYGTVRTNIDGTISVHVVWRYKIGGKVRQTPIGTWKESGGKSLREIRIIKNKLAIDKANGKDPIEDKEAERLKKQANQIEAKQTQISRLQELAAKEARITVRGLFDLWHRTDLRNRHDRGSEALRAFERDVFPIIGQVAVADVNKAHIQNIIDEMLKRDVKRMTERVLSDLRQLFGFALDRDYIVGDPTARIKKHKIGGNVERDRVLSEAELIAFFKLLPASGLLATSQNALLISLSTGSRIGETLKAHWHHVDLQRRTWTQPEVSAAGRFTKNGKRHAIYLNDMALSAFEALHQQSGLTPWVFPNMRLDGSVNLKTVSKQVSDRQRGDGEPMRGRSKQVNSLALAGGKWTPHDLRRTAATLMAELGVLPDVIDRCLNHTEQTKVKRIYQRAQYETPMREAWQKLGLSLELLNNNPGNVIRFVKAA